MTWPQGYGLKEFAELDSTNEEARRLAQSGERGPLWLLAARQSAGRGRQGRVWQGKEGNLFATLLIQPKRPKAEWAQLSFVTAIAVADMAARFTPSVAVKWPNDVLASGGQSAEVCSGSARDCPTQNNYRKLSGILLETAGDALAIGVGVNLTAHPADTEFPAISLAALGARPPQRRDALALLAQDFGQWYDVWEKAGFAPVRDAWLARAAGLGSRIRARLPGREHVGVFEGIDDQGALLLNEGNRVRAIAAADVYFE